MARYTKTTLGTNYASKAALDQNFDDIKTAIDDTLSRKGDSPNQMEADLDMNSNQILNLPDAISPGEPVTLRQFNAQSVGTKTTQTLKQKHTATAGQTVFVTPQYVIGSNNLSVYINGVRQDSAAYSETTTTSVTLSEGVESGDIVEVLVNELQESVDQVGAASVTYDGSTVDEYLDKYKHHDTVALAKANTALNVGDRVKTWGYTTAGDGGGAEYLVVAGGTGTDDGGSYHDMSNGNQLKLIHNGTVNVEQFGASPSASASANATAIQAAIDSLPASVSGRDPSRYVDGGGTVAFGKGIFTISSPIKITHNVTLVGRGIGGTVLKASGNIDVIQIEYKYPVLSEYYITNANVRHMSIDGATTAEAGITNRTSTGSNPVTYSKIEDVEIVGCKVGVHLFGAWNNGFKNVTVRSEDIDSTTEEGMFGFILETVSTGNTYGPTGHTVTANNGAGGVNNNHFQSVVCLYLKRAGVYLSAISTSHAYSNTFVDCNFEQIIKQASGMAYSPYTDANRTPEGLTSTAQAWDGRAAGVVFVGRVASCNIQNCYIERISDTGVNDGGVGVVYDDLGITFGGGASKCWQNRFVGNFVNSNVERVAQMSNCDNTFIADNSILLSSGTDKGYLVEAGSSSTVFSNEMLANINSSSVDNYNWLSATDSIGLNEPVRDNAWLTIDTGSVAAMDIYRTGSTANFDAIRFRDGTNASNIAEIGYNFSQLILNGTSTVALQSGGSEKLRVDGTSTAGQTALLLYDVDNGTVERVTVGAADSGGTGYKVLRIPN